MLVQSSYMIATSSYSPAVSHSRSYSFPDCRGMYGLESYGSEYFRATYFTWEGSYFTPILKSDVE